MRLHRLAAASLAIGALGSLPLGGCNVFFVLDRCASDSECPSGFTCDLEALYCVKPGPGQDGSRSDVDPTPQTDGGSDAPADAPPTDAPTLDAPADVDATPPPACDLAQPFGAPTLVRGFESMSVTTARMFANELRTVYSTQNGCELEECSDFFLARRTSIDAPFVSEGPMPGVSSNQQDYWASLTTDTLLFFFESNRSLTKVDGKFTPDRSRIWSATRPNTTAEFSEPRVQTLFQLPDGPEGVGEASPYLHPNGKSLYFTSAARGGSGAFDIFVATLGDFGTAQSIENLAPLNSAANEFIPVITHDERTLYFAREIAGLRHIYRSTRSGPGAPFPAPEPMPDLVNDWDEFPDDVSADGCRFYFVSNRPVADASGPPYKLWVAERPKL